MESVPAESFLGDNGEFAENWHESLPEGTFARDDTGNLVMANLGDHKNLASLSKAYVESQKRLGTALTVPAKDAPDEVKREFYNKLGCPATPDDYKLERPSGMPDGMGYDEEAEKAVRAAAHKIGVSQEHLAALSNVLNASVAARVKREMEASEKALAEAESKLRAEWPGDEYDKGLEKARRAYDIYGTKELVELFTAYHLHQHPVVVRAFKKIYDEIGEGQFVGGEPAGGGTTPPPGQLQYPKSDMRKNRT